MRFQVTLSSSLCLAALLGSPLSAQSQRWEVSASTAGELLGTSLVRTADLDGDLVPDLLAGAPRASFATVNSGSVYVISGATGAEIRRVDGSHNGELFGQVVARCEDLDGDNVPDWIVGAPFASIGVAKNGRAEARSGADGSFLFEVQGIEAFSLTGSAVAGIGDANGDTVPDVVVCAPYEDSNGIDSGTVNVHSGVDGTVIRSHTGDGTGDRLGVTAVGLGDINGDGVGDYAAGTPYANNGFGMLRVYSGLTGGILYTRLGTELDAGFASAVCVVQDMTGDGRGDIAIGIPGSDLAGVDAGQAIVINGATGALFQVYSSTGGQQRGSSIADAGDWNADGTTDLLLGAPGSGSAGTVYIISGADQSQLGAIFGDASNQNFKHSVAGGFDLDNDGHSEVAVGSPLADAGGNDSGVVRAYSHQTGLGTLYCFGDGTSQTCPCGNLASAATGCMNSTGAGARLIAMGSASASNDDLLLSGSGLLPGQAGLAFAGTDTVFGGFGAIFGDGLRCAGGAVQRLDVRIPNVSGEATWGPGLGAVGGWGSGDTRYFQIWYRDTTGGPCANGFNLSNGLQLSLLP